MIEYILHLVKLCIELKHTCVGVQQDRSTSTGRILNALIVTPTRELAIQVEQAFNEFAAFTELQIAVLFGGVGYAAQKKALQDGVDIIGDALLFV